MTVILLRDEIFPSCMRGTLFVMGKEFQILERPWVDNKRNISCIPQGVYDVCKLKKSSSGKYRDVFYVMDVPDRSGVLTHNGNIVSHTRGCLIAGKRRGKLAGKPAVLNSRSAMAELNNLIEDETFKLIVIGGY